LAEARRVLVLNGPNLNMLGVREPGIYGRDTLADIERLTVARAATHGLAVDFRQSDAEGELVRWIQGARNAAAGIVINPAAFTHTSVAILDALKLTDLPVIELHLSNIHTREGFRRHSFISPIAAGIICGFGATGYALAIDAMAALLNRPA